jgi:hypothetical protein
MDSMASCVQRIGELAEDKLDTEAFRLVGIEKDHMAQMIAHLAEIARRKLHLAWGFDNLFTYCVTRLKLSEGSVYLRIQVANVCRRFPAVLDLLAQNRMTLTVAGRLAPHLTDDNFQKLLSDCEGMTGPQIKEYVVQFKPKSEVTSGIRKAVDRSVPGCGESATTETANTGTANTEERTTADASLLAPAASCAGSAASTSTPSVEPARPDVFNFRFSADGSFKQKIERLAEVLGVHDCAGNLATVLESAIDVALDKKDPQKKSERRQKREEKKASRVESEGDGQDEPRPDEAPSSTGSSQQTGPSAEHSRYVSSEVRERVFEKAGYQCEFVGPRGRCEQRTGLQVDHIHPFKKNGPTVETNLQCLCQAHNLWRAEQEYGEAFIRSKIKDR